LTTFTHGEGWMTVRRVGQLADNALQVAIAHDAEQVATTAPNLFDVQRASTMRDHQSAFVMATHLD